MAEGVAYGVRESSTRAWACLLHCISPFNAFKLCVSQPSASSFLTPTPFHKSQPSLTPKLSPEEFSDKERLTLTDQYRWTDFDTAPVVKKRPPLGRHSNPGVGGEITICLLKTIILDMLELRSGQTIKSINYWSS
ncbi:hypothetical protein DPX16_8034 [Anabarilius grahami]|uniref:Uncharacterized protein n=1 Tax=Anabarilius grahami TaxID=495550 RepID=A0A3N0Z481_ANAGA|nr:hypothetical protein DPX16_8034 [Anabarilius grahami]